MKEKAFISLVFTTHNDATKTGVLLEELHEALDRSFESYEIVVVDNASTDATSAEISRVAALFGNKTVRLTLPWQQPDELAIFAGLEFAMGDFVFDVEHLDPGFPPNLFLDLFKKAAEGYDVVNVIPANQKRFATSLFYTFFEKVSHLNLRLETHNIRLVTRRALNALFKIKQKVRYRKAQYIYTGYKNTTVPYPLTGKEPRGSSILKRADLAFDLIVSFSNIGLKVALALSSLFFTFSIVGGIFAIVMYFVKNHPAEGWTTLMLFSSFGFSGLFLLMSILLKYLITLLREVQQNPLYVVSDITVHSKHNA